MSQIPVARVTTSTDDQSVTVSVSSLADVFAPFQPKDPQVRAQAAAPIRNPALVAQVIQAEERAGRLVPPSEPAAVDALPASQPAPASAPPVSPPPPPRPPVPGYRVWFHLGPNGGRSSGVYTYAYVSSYGSKSFLVLAYRDDAAGYEPPLCQPPQPPMPVELADGTVLMVYHFGIVFEFQGYTVLLLPLATARDSG